MIYVCTLLLPPSCTDILVALLPQVNRLVCDAARTSRDGGSEKWCDRRQALTRARPALRTRKGAAKRRPVWAGTAGLSNFSLIAHWVMHIGAIGEHEQTPKAVNPTNKIFSLVVGVLWCLCAKTNGLRAHPPWSPCCANKDLTVTTQSKDRFVGNIKQGSEDTLWFVVQWQCWNYNQLDLCINYVT